MAGKIPFSKDDVLSAARSLQRTQGTYTSLDVWFRIPGRTCGRYGDRHAEMAYISAVLLNNGAKTCGYRCGRRIYRFEKPAATLEDINGMSLQQAAEIYMQEGWTLVPLAPESKSASVSRGWNSPRYSNAKMFGGLQHWNYFLSDNIGVHLGKSGLVTLDIDNKDAFLTCMQAIAEKLPKGETPFWKSDTAGIVSGRAGSGKLVFKAPRVNLEPEKLRWRNGGTGMCVFELRTKGQQDVLPPSVHPDTKKRYQWVGTTIRDMPEDLLCLWQHWTEFQPLMEMADPSYVPPAVTGKMRNSGIRYEGTNYIEMWKNQQNLRSLLTSYGYTGKGPDRLLSPSSHTGKAGIVLYESGTKFYSFGASDRFADGHIHDAYDVLVECEFRGDRKAAWNYILDYFGVDRQQCRAERDWKRMESLMRKRRENNGVTA